MHNGPSTGPPRCLPLDSISCSRPEQASAPARAHGWPDSGAAPRFS